MAHRKRKETKQQPSMLPGPAVPVCCLVSFHFLWAILCPQAVHGHGNMVQPMAWYDEDQLGWEWDENGASNHLGCGVLDMPSDNEFTITNDKEPDCYNYWFSNQVRGQIQ